MVVEDIPSQAPKESQVRDLFKIQSQAKKKATSSHKKLNFYNLK